MSLIEVYIKLFLGSVLLFLVGIGLYENHMASKVNCPCGESATYSVTSGPSCVWNYFYIDPRKQCQSYNRPAR